MYFKNSMNINGIYDSISSEESLSLDLNQEEQSLPKKIKWTKTKKFTKIRNNYKNYNESNLDWDKMFNEVDSLKNNGVPKYLRITSKKYNINYKTFRNKYSKWKTKQLEANITENRGNGTILSEKEEKELFEYIKCVYIETDLFFDDQCLGLIAKRKWNELYPYRKDEFKASRYWVYSFKRRWNLSSFKGRNSKKAKFTDITERKLFTERCKKFKNENPNSYMFNMDETYWRLLNGNLDVIGIKGSDNRKVITNLLGKEGFTVILLISDDGKFHKPNIIIKGKTNRCLNKISLDDNNKRQLVLTHSESGWNNTNITSSILEQIYKTTGGNKSALIMDKHSSHKGDDIDIKAKEYNIQIIYVPTGMTSILQPLDIKINGPLKCIGHKYIKNMYVNDPYYCPNLNDALCSLIHAINNIDSLIIKSSFNVLNE